MFKDVTGLAPGQEVRIAGVRVGEVKSIKVATDRVHADVEFNVLKTSVLTQGTKATIKYRNLIGERYIALTQDVGSATPLKDGATIGLDHTQSALDLTVLFNGFKPLFAALSPKDVNELSGQHHQRPAGRGRQHQLAAGQDRVPDLDPRRPRRGHRPHHLQPQHRARHRGRPRRRAQGADRPAPAVHLGPGRRPHDHRCLADQHQLADGARPPTCSRSPVPRSRRTSATCAASRPTSTSRRTPRPSRSSCRPRRARSTRSPAPRPTAPGSTSTCATSAARSSCRRRPRVPRPSRSRSTSPAGLSGSEVLVMSIPFRERNPVPIGAAGLLAIALVLFLAFNVQSIPFIGGGDHYRAAFSEAGGLIKGDDVRIAGVKVGKVEKVDLAGNHVVVDFKVTEPAAFGTRTGASVRMKTLAGLEVPRPRAGRWWPAQGGQRDPAGADRLVLRHRQRVHRPRDHVRGDRHRRAREVADHPRDRVQGQPAGRQGGAGRPQPAVQHHRLARRRAQASCSPRPTASRAPSPSATRPWSRSSRTPTCSSSSSTPAATPSTRCSPTPRRWPSRSPGWSGTTAPSSSRPSTS